MRFIPIGCLRAFWISRLPYEVASSQACTWITWHIVLTAHHRRYIPVACFHAILCHFPSTYASAISIHHLTHNWRSFSTNQAAYETITVVIICSSYFKSLDGISECSNVQTPCAAYVWCSLFIDLIPSSPHTQTSLSDGGCANSERAHPKSYKSS